MTWSKAGLASLGLPPKSCETCTGKDLYILQTTEALMDDTDDSRTYLQEGRLNQYLFENRKKQITFTTI